MSAFIMDRHEIWYLVEACYMYAEEGLPEKHELARQLWQDNIRAVKLHYHDEENLPGPVGETFEISDDEPIPIWPDSDFHPIQVIKAAKCYLFQTETLPDNNPSRRLMKWLINMAIQDLPGYEEATWGGPPPIEEKKGGRSV